MAGGRGTAGRQASIRDTDQEHKASEPLRAAEPAGQDPAASSTARVLSNFVPALGNFSVQYNFTAASFAVLILQDEGYLGHPLLKEPGWSKDLTLPIVFLGAMLGMVVMGRLGDVLGRARAMQVTLIMASAGAVIPAIPWGHPNVVYGIVGLGRIILGVGVGGIYPLSAVSSAECTGSNESKGVHVGKAFLWQSVGVVVTYLIAMLLVGAIQPKPPQTWAPELQYRLLFAMGALPNLIVLWVSRGTEDSQEFRSHRHRESYVAAFRNAPRGTKWTLIGTAGSWFIYDVAYYGTSIFTPDILKAICLAGSKDAGECKQTLEQTALQSAFVAAMGVPGCLLSIAAVSCMGCKLLNVVGFGLLAVNFAVIAVVWSVSPGSHGLLFGLFCFLSMLLNWGPNLGTYVLPAICFPTHMRSTCHGLSATGGKLGALVGALLFEPISQGKFGVPGVLWLQASLCIVGMVVAQVFLKHDWEYSSGEEQDHALDCEARVS